MDRRHFIKTASITGATLAYSSSRSIAVGTPVPKRPYGDTGEELSVIGFGGIVVKDTEQSHANKVVAQAYERGVNYFDVAPTYGNAEERLGPALEPFRKECFLACKTQKRDAAGAEEELNQSLKTLRTDYFDLYQLHAMTRMEDVEQVLAPGGAMETFLKAKEAGKVRYLGFSAHSAEAALALMDQFDFDSILFPFNYVTWHEGNFGPEVIKKAKEKGVARLALKALAHSPWTQGADRGEFNKCWYEPVSDREKAAKALGFTLSLDVTAAIPPGEESLFMLALDLAQGFKPLTETEQEEVEELAQGVTPIFKRQA